MLSIGRLVEELFIVDSGADMSLAPRSLCDLLGLKWESGAPIELLGISQREECNVRGIIQPIEIFVHQAGLRVKLPICFAEGNAPLLLGRAGFFDAFRIQFDKPQLLTTFETV